MPIRYMGTKKVLAPAVRKAVVSLKPNGRVADLFAGMGSVSAELASDYPVLANDALAFSASVLRARFTDRPRASVATLVSSLRPCFERAHSHLHEEFSRRIRKEQEAMRCTSPEPLADYIREAPHAGNSDAWRHKAKDAASETGTAHYKLATLYFSAGYFSTRQAIELDSIRYAIDRCQVQTCRDGLLSAWIAAAASAINAPGHAAQYLKPRTASAYVRVRRQWRRRVWELFLAKLDSLTGVGTRSWRRRNLVTSEHALELAEVLSEYDVGAVYADPPYTRDQYSRFYHVHETLYRYNYPDSRGAGRYPSHRFVTPFSHVTKAKRSFEHLFGLVAEAKLPLVLSYPENGLVETHNGPVSDLLEASFSSVTNHPIQHAHSTLGASNGHRSKAAKENIYVCTP